MRGSPVLKTPKKHVNSVSAGEARIWGPTPTGEPLSPFLTPSSNIIKSEYSRFCNMWGFLSQLKNHELIDKRIKRYDTVFWPLTERKDWWMFSFNLNKIYTAFFRNSCRNSYFFAYIWSKVKCELEYFSIFFWKKSWSFPFGNAFENVSCESLNEVNNFGFF